MRATCPQECGGAVRPTIRVKRRESRRSIHVAKNFHPSARALGCSMLPIEGGQIGIVGLMRPVVWILGRNMFGPVRGPWLDESRRGWWGEEPYHTPVFVLTHHARAAAGGGGRPEFRFVTDGIHAALDQAKAAADGRDVRFGGGVSTIRRYLRVGLIDELVLV